MRERSPVFWILLVLVVGSIGLAIDKGFADNTPPYDEPVIAYIGFSMFMACGFAFIVLCSVALIRIARGSTSVAVAPAVTSRPVGAAIVFALVVFAGTQAWFWWGASAGEGTRILVFLFSISTAIALLVLAVRVSRRKRKPD